MAFTAIEKKRLAALPVEERERQLKERKTLRRKTAAKKLQTKKSEVSLTATYNLLVQQWYDMYRKLP